jgi:hypothetical protein
MVRASDAAWAAIVAAHGHVQGKVFWMRKETRDDIARERGITALPTLYGVPIRIDPLMKRGSVMLR